MYHLQSLGGVVVRDAGGEVVSLRSRKHLALLLYLSAHPGRVFTRDALATLFWDSEIERARHSLSQAIYDLRRSLDRELILTSGTSVRLDGSRLVFDARQLEEAIRSADVAAAIRIYRGPFAPDLEETGSVDFERWVEAERLRLQRLGRMALRTHVRECDAAGRWGALCVTALRLVQLDPLDEETHRDLMRGLWLNGDGESAIAHFEQVLAPLAEELPEGLSPRTLRLVEKIRSAPSPRPAPTGSSTEEPIPPFVGREAEFARLRRAAHEIGATPLEAVLVTGEAGIGKSRLLEELAHSLRFADLRLVQSRCYPAEEEVPYGGLMEALRPLTDQVLGTMPREQARLRFHRIGHLVPEFHHLVRPDAETIDPSVWKRRLYEEIVEMVRLATREEPLLWIIEDIQWMDSTSRSLVHFISRRLRDRPLLLVLSMRLRPGAPLPDELPVRDPDESGATEWIGLARLEDGRLREMLDAVLPETMGRRTIELAVRLSAGNPFFALEILRAAARSTDWADEARAWDLLTDSRLRRVLSVRFRDLPDHATRLLRAMAVLERYATPHNVAALTGITPDLALEQSDELYRRGIVQDDGRRMEFVNELTREYAYREIGILELSALHLSAGKVLSEDENSSSGAIARHFYIGGDKASAYFYAMKAGREMASSGGHLEAAAMGALAAKSALTRHEKADALELQAEAELVSGQLSSARQHFDEVLAIDVQLPLERRLRIKLQKVRSLGAGSDWVSARSELADLGRQIASVQPRNLRVELRFELLTWSLRAALRANDDTEASDVNDKIVRLLDAARQTSDLTPTAELTAVTASAAYQLFYRSAKEALALLRRVTSLTDTVSGDIRFRFDLTRGLAHLRAAEWDAANHHLKQALAYARKTNNILQLAPILNNLACNSLERGDWADAESHLDGLEKLADRLVLAHDARIPAELNRANILFYQGFAQSAHEHYSALLAAVDQHSQMEFFAELTACVGLTALQLGLPVVVKTAAAELENWTEEDLAGVQERFKIDWFVAYLLRFSDPEGASLRLLSAADRQAEVDKPSALKTLWIHQLLFEPHSPASTASSELNADLKRHGMEWFARFSRRWLTVSDAKRHRATVEIPRTS